MRYMLEWKGFRRLYLYAMSGQYTVFLRKSFGYNYETRIFYGPIRQYPWYNYITPSIPGAEKQYPITPRALD